MRRAAAALTVLVALGAAAAPAAAGEGSAAAIDGFITGREHEVRVRSVLAEIAPEPAKLSRVARAFGALVVKACDPEHVIKLRRRVPTSPETGDDPSVCVVLTKLGDDERVMLSPATLTGSELGRVSRRLLDHDRELVLVELSPRGEQRWAFFGGQAGDAPLAVTLDGTVYESRLLNADAETATGKLAFVIGGKKGLSKDEAARVRDALAQAEHEEVIELARQASLSRGARKLFASTDPVIREKADFAEGCPLPEADDTFVLGCYTSLTNDISVLRVDRADLLGVMPVTAAHEVLHAAYARLSLAERSKVDQMIAVFLVESPQPRIEQSLALYTEEERANEVHSLVGTEIRLLPPPLERYYARYFDDRSAVVTLFEGYQVVFDQLETRFAVLQYELASLDNQLNGVRAQADAAAAESDRLFNQIESLRSQGRFDEANNLVDAQNAAAGRANSLASQYNALVQRYNATVTALNEAALSLGDLYEQVSPVS